MLISFASMPLYALAPSRPPEFFTMTLVGFVTNSVDEMAASKVPAGLMRHSAPIHRQAKWIASRGVM